MTDHLREALEGQGVNFEETMARFMGMEALYEKFLKKFPDDENYQKLIDMVQKGETQEAFSAAHTLKGVAGNLGFGALFNAVAPLVETLRSGEPDGVGQQVELVKEKYEAICNLIQKELGA